MPDTTATAAPDTFALPARIQTWFAARGWQPRAHQLQLAKLGLAGKSALLIAPTGGGKTLAGFLPSLIDLEAAPPPKPGRGRPHQLHTLYISPLKALAVDIARNLETPITEMGLDIRLETRTGDTPAHKRVRQKTLPPDILLTTPEQLALLLASREAAQLFRSLKYVVIDELHALAGNKRGDLLALDLARLRHFSDNLTAIGLSATVKYRDELRRFLVPQNQRGTLAELVEGHKGAAPKVEVLHTQAEIPWAGHLGRHATQSVYEAIKSANTALLFVNTRSQAELLFQDLWHANEDGLAIALHHGSLAVEQRRKVENAMAEGRLRAVVCTSTLDLGVDWAAVDLVVQMGAPKGASRLLQRIGRANHRLDEPSHAVLVPTNRFEVLECTAAREAVTQGILDGDAPRAGALDVLAQHVLGVACAGPFSPRALYEEIITAGPYANLHFETYERVVAFVTNGGYALKTYDQFRKLVPTPEGLLRLAHPSIAQRYRLNVGTIIEEPMLKVRLGRAGKRGNGAPLRGGRVLGEIEEYFIEQLAPGDTFLFAGEVLRFEGLHETEAFVTRTDAREPKIPSYMGGKFPLSTYLADRVRHILANRGDWKKLPEQVQEWLRLQRLRSLIPKPDELLIETFPRGTRFYLTAYPFDGRLAHQTLGMLITRRLERMRMRPLGFVANEYALQIWGLRDMSGLNMAKLLDEDIMGDDLEAWLAESALLKRGFRNCALISGLIERRFAGSEKTGRQVTFSSDLIYDVLRSHEPDHILLEAARHDAATGQLDLLRLAALLKRIQGRIVLKTLSRVSPLAVPVMLEIGRVPVAGEALEDILETASETLIEEAMQPDD